jgi:NAD+ synthase (glutamine-hydrolysing)
MPILRIAQAQINTTVGDLAANLDIIAQEMQKAKSSGAQMVTFPELAICGYPPEDLVLKPRFITDCRAALDKLAGLSRGITCIVGLPMAKGDKLYNSAAVLHHGEIAAVYNKIELPNYGVFDEKRYFTPGDGCLLLELMGLRILVTICEDVWIKGNLLEKAAAQAKAQISLNISASPFHAGKAAMRREDIMGGFARRTGSWMLHNNLVGGQDELVFDGGSLVINPAGGVVAGSVRFNEALLVCDVELPGQAEHIDPQPHCQVTVLEPCQEQLQQQDQQEGQQCQGSMAADMGLVEEIHQALVLGTRDYVRKNGFSKVVLGLSGGIDSALTAAIAVEALGSDNVVGVTMPSQYTSGETLGDAGQLAKNLGIKLHTIPIKQILEGYLAELSGTFGKGELGVEAENLQARIRGNILMALSNRFGYMVLTTGNKSEVAVGYCTLYGDTAGGFAVIKDLPKTLVYEVSEHLNKKAGRELIPQTTITRPPTAELRPDQKDTDSLPPYEVLDPILKAYVEEDLVADEIIALGYDPDLVKRIARLVDLNEYKRRQAAPGVKITPKAFGKDRRLPITNHYRSGM